MAIKQTKMLALSDVTSLPVEGEVTMQVITRIRELHFPYPSGETHKLILEPFLNGPENGQKRDDVTVEFKAEPQEQVPAEDVLDPETGEVAIAAGSLSPPLPSVAELHATPLPEGPQTVETFGQLFDVARRQLYLAITGLVPSLSDGVED